VSLGAHVVVRIAILRATADEPQARAFPVSVAAQSLVLNDQRAARRCHRAAKLRAKHGGKSPSSSTHAR
jgi:hypothetical protein